MKFLFVSFTLLFNFQYTYAGEASWTITTEDGLLSYKDNRATCILRKTNNMDDILYFKATESFKGVNQVARFNFALPAQQVIKNASNIIIYAPIHRFFLVDLFQLNTAKQIYFGEAQEDYKKNCKITFSVYNKNIEGIILCDKMNKTIEGPKAITRVEAQFQCEIEE